MWSRTGRESCEKMVYTQRAQDHTRSVREVLSKRQDLFSNLKVQHGTITFAESLLAVAHNVPAVPSLQPAINNVACAMRMLRDRLERGIKNGACPSSEVSKLDQIDKLINDRLCQLKFLLDYAARNGEGVYGVVANPDALALWIHNFDATVTRVSWDAFYHAVVSPFRQDNITMNEAFTNGLRDILAEYQEGKLVVTAERWHRFTMWFQPFHRLLHNFENVLQRGCLDTTIRSASEAEARLADKPPGTFILRWSREDDTVFTVDFIVVPAGVRHCRMIAARAHPEDELLFGFTSGANLDATPAATLLQVLERNASLLSVGCGRLGGGSMPLSHPSRQTPPPTYGSNGTAGRSGGGGKSGVMSPRVDDERPTPPEPMFRPSTPSQGNTSNKSPFKQRRTSHRTEHSSTSSKSHGHSHRRPSEDDPLHAGGGVNLGGGVATPVEPASLEAAAGPAMITGFGFTNLTGLTMPRGGGGGGGGGNAPAATAAVVNMHNDSMASESTAAADEGETEEARKEREFLDMYKAQYSPDTLFLSVSKPKERTVKPKGAGVLKSSAVVANSTDNQTGGSDDDRPTASPLDHRSSRRRQSASRQSALAAANALNSAQPMPANSTSQISFAGSSTPVSVMMQRSSSPAPGHMVGGGLGPMGSLAIPSSSSMVPTVNSAQMGAPQPFQLLSHQQPAIGGTHPINTNINTARNATTIALGRSMTPKPVRNDHFQQALPVGGTLLSNGRPTSPSFRSMSQPRTRPSSRCHVNAPSPSVPKVHPSHLAGGTNSRPISPAPFAVASPTTNMRSTTPTPLTAMSVYGTSDTSGWMGGGSTIAGSAYGGFSNIADQSTFQTSHGHNGWF